MNMIKLKPGIKETEPSVENRPLMCNGNQRCCKVVVKHPGECRVYFLDQSAVVDFSHLKARTIFIFNDIQKGKNPVLGIVILRVSETMHAGKTVVIYTSGIVDLVGPVRAKSL